MSEQKLVPVEPTVIFCTQRMCEDEIHIECRMSDGQKGAFVKVDIEFPELADKIEAFLAAAPNNAETTRDSAGNSPKTLVSPAPVSAPYKHPLAWDVLAWLGKWRDSIPPDAVNHLQDIVIARDVPSPAPGLTVTPVGRPDWKGLNGAVTIAMCPSKLPPDDTYSNRCASCGKDFLAIGKRQVICPDCKTPSKLPLNLPIKKD